MPVARGSRLPVCPPLRAANSLLTRCRAWLERQAQTACPAESIPSMSRLPRDARPWPLRICFGGAIRMAHPRFVSFRASQTAIGADGAVYEILERPASRQRLIAEKAQLRNAASRAFPAPVADRRKPAGRAQARPQYPDPAAPRTAACSRPSPSLRSLETLTSVMIDAVQPGIAGLARKSLAQNALNRLFQATAARKLPWHGMTRRERFRPRSDRSGHLNAFKALDLVADLDVAVVAHADAAFGTGPDLRDVVLETPQRIELSLEDHDVVAEHAHRDCCA